MRFKPAVRKSDDKHLYCSIDNLHLRGLRSIRLAYVVHQNRNYKYQQVLEAIKNGASLKECAQIDPQVLKVPKGDHRNYGEILFECFEPERQVLERQVHYVEDGLSTMPKDIYRLSDMRVWDGYDAHKSVYIDQQQCKLTIAELLTAARQARHDNVYISKLPNEERQALQTSNENEQDVD